MPAAASNAVFPFTPCIADHVVLFCRLVVTRALIVYATMAISVSAFAVPSPAQVETPWWDDPLQVLSGRFSYGSGRLLYALWPESMLSHPLPGDDGTATAAVASPERREPLRQRPPVRGAFFGSIRGVDTDKPLIALTFDLCQQAGRPSGYDAEIVRILRAFDAKATFFAGGMWMRAHQERAMQLMADPRFEVGSHGWSHKDAGHGEGDLQTEVLLAQSQYELVWEQLYGRAARAGLAEEMALVPRLPLTFRFPYGSCGAQDLKNLSALGLPAVQWSVAPGDPDPGRSAEALSASILDRARPGSIVVLHANGRGKHTAKALRIALPSLKERGYAFVTVSDLLSAGRPRAVSTCYVLEPGDLER